jgi:hypothetical protein
MADLILNKYFPHVLSDIVFKYVGNYKILKNWKIKNYEKLVTYYLVSPFLTLDELIEISKTCLNIIKLNMAYSTNIDCVDIYYSDFKKLKILDVGTKNIKFYHVCKNLNNIHLIRC